MDSRRLAAELTVLSADVSRQWQQTLVGDIGRWHHTLAADDVQQTLAADDVLKWIGQQTSADVCCPILIVCCPFCCPAWAAAPF